MVAFYDFPEDHTTNVVESPFAAVRLRTTAAKRFKRVESATALIWKLLLVAARLALGRSARPTLHRQMGQERVHLLDPKLVRVAHALVADESTDPRQIGPPRFAGCTASLARHAIPVGAASVRVDLVGCLMTLGPPRRSLSSVL